MISNKKFNRAAKTISCLVLFSIVFTNAFVYGAVAKNKLSTDRSALDKFTTDLTELARAERIKADADFSAEVGSLVEVLAGGIRQPVVLDENGKNQEIVVEQLALRLASSAVPNALKGKRLLKLEINQVFSQNAAESRLTLERIFDELAASKGDVILFVDELTAFVGDASVNNPLTNLLLQRKMQIIGGSSRAAYKEKIEDDSNISALFHQILIGGGSVNDVTAENQSDKNQNDFQGDNVSADLREMMGRDTTGNERADVILQAKDAENPVFRRIMADNNVRLTERIGESDTLAVNLLLRAVEALAQSGAVNYMSPDRAVKTLGHLENTTGAAATRAQTATAGRAAFTLDGTGVGIAVLDSGLLANHKSFMTDTAASRIVYSRNFVPTSTTTDDEFGHGTHVAGIAAGNSGRDAGAFRGVAPNANIVNLKVLNNRGVGKTAWLLSALQWIVVNGKTHNIRVVNLSLGGLAIDSYTNDPVCRKVQELNALGILVVAAAGNDGKNLSTGQKLYGHIHSPGNSPAALTVGAVNTMQTDARGDDVMASFSSHGPTRSFYVNTNGVKVYDNAIKPDLVAPGNKIISARAGATSYLASSLPSLSLAGLTTTGDDSMISMSGTSMSTPAAAGAAALLFEQNPNLTPNMVKMILEYTAQPLKNHNMLEQGAGQLNIEGAIRLARTYKSSFTSSLGMPLMTGGVALPTASSTVGGTTFAWAQGILTNHAYVKGTSLISQYQTVYSPGATFEDGILYVFKTQNLNAKYSGAALHPNVLTSNGATMGSGTIFCAAGVLVSDGVLASDGNLFGDGVLVSDGVLASDGVLVSDGTNANTDDSVIGGDE